MPSPLPTETHDRKMFSILVRQHHRRLIAFARSITGNADVARDVVQESFVTAWDKLHTFDTQRDFGAWMRGIVRNKCREAARKRSLVLVDEEALEAIEMAHRDWEAAEQQSGESVFAALSRCIDKLPEPLATVIDRFYLQRLSGRETAEALDMNEATVRKRLQRARETLRPCIETELETAHV